MGSHSILLLSDVWAEILKVDISLSAQKIKPSKLRFVSYLQFVSTGTFVIKLNKKEKGCFILLFSESKIQTQKWKKNNFRLYLKKKNINHNTGFKNLSRGFFLSSKSSYPKNDHVTWYITTIRRFVLKFWGSNSWPYLTFWGNIFITLDYSFCRNKDLVA